ncbi:MAG: endonuclease V [Myxococcota bacterium]
MWWATDVQYSDDRAVVAGLGFLSFADDAGEEHVLEVPGAPEAYEPGAFYKRELPLLLDLLRGRTVTGVVVDGFVWLGPDRPGLGAHLHGALGGVPVIGVAKTGFQGADAVAEAVLRGQSERPLWVTAEGVAVDRAARWIRQMHGPHRIPTLLKRVDRLCRGEDG